MTKEEAIAFVDYLRNHGFQAGLVGEEWGKIPGDETEWHVVAETRDGRLMHLFGEDAVYSFLEKQGYGMQKEYHMERYLVCSTCGKAYSADPRYYRGAQGILACCGRALKLYRADATSNTPYLVAESVDAEYLSSAHTDKYTDLPPLLTLRIDQIAAENVRGSAPDIPANLRKLLLPKPEPGVTPEQLGYALYKVATDAMWMGHGISGVS